MGLVRVAMIREDMEGIPEHPLRPGYSFRCFREGDEDLWVSVQGDADRLQTIGRATFDGQFGHDLPAMLDRTFFVIAPNGDAAGAISAWYGDEPRGNAWGRIHWVAVRPSHQNLGLGKAMMTRAMKRLAQSHDRCYLTTATARVAAIKVYLDFGFLPDLSLPEARDAWRSVARSLPHPAFPEMRLDR